MTELDRESLARASYERAYPSGIWAEVSTAWRDYWFTIIGAFEQDIERQGFQITRREHD